MSTSNHTPLKNNEIEMGWSDATGTFGARGTQAQQMFMRVEKLYEDDDHQRFFESIHYKEDAKQQRIKIKIQRKLEQQRFKEMNMQKQSKKYVIFAILSSLFFSGSAVLRRYHSRNVFFTNTIITSSFLLSYLVFLLIRKIVYKKRKEKVIYPWCIKDPYDTLSDYKFSKKHLILLILGGVTEFFGNALLTISFLGAIEGHYNTGISSSLHTTNTIYVLILSYLFFREKILPSQVIGIFVLLGSVSVVNIFRKEGWTGWDLDHEVEGIQIDQTHNLMKIILGGLGSAFLFGSQIVFYKEQMKRCEDAFFSAFTFLLFCGILGFFSIIYYLIFDFGVFEQHNHLQYLTSMASGISISIGIGLINVACEEGQSGVSLTIYHTQIIQLSLMNMFIFGDTLTIIQIIGIAGVFMGAVLVSVELDFSQFIKKKQTSSHKTQKPNKQ